ncbi:single-stranded DNA exonuclease RecJ [Nitrosopumilus oxyclinae]|uniref:Single-stranded DNA exonuclease RecJ n=1 Tax=Nitrosopumilus oxyclinae TaxID=1959104 RepID=A0A7D5R572_9ARCH|nr:DHHA1 domain-containing protein [Nitrosopumilus oxyclinae]QLH04959.1 single-stranded DNA exonuclease RecJ [Nitrosopumilus oxyclinae]
MVSSKTKKTAAKKVTKKTAAKKVTKKTAAKKVTKKTAAKKVTKKTAAKKVTKKTAAKKTSSSKRTKVICISHKEDCDGISSAALIRQAFGGDAILVDYPGQMEALNQVVLDEKLKSLFICDLGLSKKTQDEFIDILTRLRKNKVSVTYIDHHDIDPNVVKALNKIKVKVIHDINECTAVLTYTAFKSKLNDHASFVAACAAITDYMESRPLGSKLLQIYDRQFALISATVMTYNIVGRQREPDYLQYLVEELADSKFPHDIPNTYEFAQIQVEKLSQMIAKVKVGLKTMSNLGHMEILDSGASGAVNFVMGLSGKNVGVAYKERVDHGIYAVSVRGSKNCKVHLGKIVNLLATSLGGSGGGHDKACGAVVPKPKIKKFITELNKKIK